MKWIFRQFEECWSVFQSLFIFAYFQLSQVVHPFNMSDHRNRVHSIPLEILDDLGSRFIINIPEAERKDLIRICFQVRTWTPYKKDFKVYLSSKICFFLFLLLVFSLFPKWVILIHCYVFRLSSLTGFTLMSMFPRQTRIWGLATFENLQCTCSII